MPLTARVLAALAAPLFEAVGFLEWDIHWSKGGGSAFALNLFKCNIAAIGFFFMVTFANNNIYLLHVVELAVNSNNPHQMSFEQTHLNNQQQRADLINNFHPHQTPNQLQQQFDEQNSNFLSHDQQDIPNKPEAHPTNNALQRQRWKILKIVWKKLKAAEEQLEKSVFQGQQKEKGLGVENNSNYYYWKKRNEEYTNWQKRNRVDGQQKETQQPHQQPYQQLQQQQQQQTSPQQRHQQQTSPQQQQQQISLRNLEHSDPITSPQPQSTHFQQWQNAHFQQWQRPEIDEQEYSLRQQHQIPFSDPTLQVSQNDPVDHHPNQFEQIHRGLHNEPQEAHFFNSPEQENPPIILNDTNKKEVLHKYHQEQQLQLQQAVQDLHHSDYVASSINLNELPKTYRHPFQGQRDHIPYLILSSFLGIIIGDCAELEALRLVGARRVLVVGSIKPIAAATLGCVFLNEALHIPGIAGILLSTYGVYIVLVASLESIKKDRDKQKFAERKRAEDYSSNNRGEAIQHHHLMKDRLDEDADGEVAYINGKATESKIKMIGMRRRPLSRHDISVEYEDGTIGIAEEENVANMMLMEDGREIIDTTICCGSSSTYDRDGLRRRGSSGSWGNMSWGEMGNHHQFDLQIMNNRDGFKEEEDDLGYFFGTDAPIGGIENKAVRAQEAMKRDQLVSIPLTSPKEKVVKSSLRKSRFGSDMIETGTRSKDIIEDNIKIKNYQVQQANNIAMSISGFSSIALSSKDNDINSTLTTVNKKETEDFRSFLKRSGSSNSVLSIESECGPPLGMYCGSNKETGIQRLIRLRTGYFLATLNVLLDAYGSYLTKKHGFGLSTWEINLCRMGFAGFFMIVISGFMRLVEYRNSNSHKIHHSKKMGSNFDFDKSNMTKWYKLPGMSVVRWITVSLGVLFVTFLYPALVNYALFEIPLALVISLTATTPLYTMPLGFIMKGDIPTKKSCMGAILSVSGVVILCLWGVDSDVFD